MTNNPILDALDDPEHVAYLASRREARRRGALVALLLVGAIVLAIGWKVTRHAFAAFWLESNHYRVVWGMDAKTWKQGGVTTVKHVEGWFLGDQSATVSHLDRVGWLHRVEELDLSSTIGLADDHLAVLDRLPLLKMLNLDRSIRQRGFDRGDSVPLTDAIMTRIGSLANLEELELGGQAITDAGLTKLRGLSRLKHLNLRSTLITDAGLATLRDLAALRSIDLTGTAVTPGAVAAFEKARPEVKVLTDLIVSRPISTP